MGHKYRHYCTKCGKEGVFKCHAKKEVGNARTKEEKI